MNLLYICGETSIVIVGTYIIILKYNLRFNTVYVYGFLYRCTFVGTSMIDKKMITSKKSLNQKYKCMILFLISIYVTIIYALNVINVNSLFMFIRIIILKLLIYNHTIN